MGTMLAGPDRTTAPSNSTGSWSTAIQNGTGGRSTLNVTSRRVGQAHHGMFGAINPDLSAFAQRGELPDISQLGGSKHRVGSKCEFLQGDYGGHESRLRIRLTGSGSSWCLAWVTVRAEKGLIPSIC